jgi:hypothetical protein
MASRIQSESDLAEGGERFFQKADVEVESPLIINMFSRVLDPLAVMYTLKLLY